MVHEFQLRIKFAAISVKPSRLRILCPRVCLAPAFVSKLGAHACAYLLSRARTRTRSLARSKIKIFLKKVWGP